MMLIVSQMHGLGLLKLTIWLLAALFIFALVFVYSDRGLSQFNEVLRIPMIDYLLVFVLAGLILLTKKLARKERVQ